MTEARLVYFGSEDKPTLAPGRVAAHRRQAPRRCERRSGGSAALDGRPDADVQSAGQRQDAPAPAARAHAARARATAARASERRHERRGDRCRLRSPSTASASSRTVPVRQHLVDFLRTELGLTGSHLGCEHGVCGACSVRVDGAVVRGCLMLAVQADGAEVVTIEGLDRHRRDRRPAGGVRRAQRAAVRLLHARHADDGGRAAGRGNARRAARRSARSCPATTAAAPAITPSSMPSRRRSPSGLRR